MEISQLRNFLAVLEHGAISQAAHQLGVAQPALSQSIARMEKSLGVKLFERSRNGALPTAAALIIADDVRSGMFRLDEASRKAKATRKGLAGSLVIGLVSSALFDVLPKALRKVRSHAPDLDITLKEMGNDELASALELGMIDIGLMHAPVTVSGHMYEKVLRQDRLIAAVPTAMSRYMPPTINLAQIAEIGLIMYPQDQLPVFYTGITDGIRKAGCSVKINMHANRTLTVMSCVAGGMGIGLLPSWISTLDFPGVTFLDISDSHHLPNFDLVAICAAKSAAAMDLLFADV
ncbi:LysR family transcriptional regulator [Pusillimonas sp. SM2304]|uniref:LysR family transcriptional regulator n=1 Tax=Pusillimonas sp. SM2304 TaxID=3073241 RepID=UPI00287501B2|nr:LysR family transcriptional regulator [Pusillimonas sp. SM2304]MDS1139163.1 LysR family transcriptional regulator [Pusillimonas sp. SM2304]